MGWKVIAPLFLWSIPKGITALAQAGGPTKVYVFRDWQGATSSAAAYEHVLQTFGSVDALANLFGGYMAFGKIFGSTEFIGVWGNRNASRFRRILSEGLDTLEVVHASPPARPSGRKLVARPSTAEREQIERAIKGRWPAPSP